MFVAALSLLNAVGKVAVSALSDNGTSVSSTQIKPKVEHGFEIDDGSLDAMVIDLARSPAAQSSAAVQSALMNVVRG